MMSSDTSHTSVANGGKKRGIIIVDTSALLRLCMPVAEEIKADVPLKKEYGDIPRYSDMLILLAQNGYEILIPEMVAFECRRILHSGNKIDDIYGFDPGKPNEVFANTEEFLKRAGHHLYKNIKIVAPSHMCRSPAAEFMRDIRRTVYKPEEESSRERIKYLNSLERSDFGDMAARDLIDTLPSNSTQVFYLCQDSKALDAMVQETQRTPPVGRLNVTGLLKGFQREKLFTAAGIDKFGSMRKSTLNIVAVMNRQFQDILKREGYDYTSIISNHFIDSTHQKGEAHDYPFLSSLKGLGRQIRGELSTWTERVNGKGRGTDFEIS